MTLVKRVVEVPTTQKNPQLFKWGAIIVIFILAILLIDTCNKKNNQEKASTQLVNALNDTLKTWKDSDSTQRATIAVLQTERAKDFLVIKSKDEEIIRLQNTVEEYKSKLRKGGSVTTGTIETKVKDSSKTDGVASKDTVWKDSIAYVYPEYTDTTINEWLNLAMKMNKDTSSFDLKVINTFNEVIGTEKGRPYTEIHLLNPYSTVKSYRVWQSAPPKKKRWGIGGQLGSSFKFENKKIKPAPYIGIGLSYNFIRF